jgi:hypothetical protein
MVRTGTVAANVAGPGLDPGRHGRNDGVGRQPGLCGHLPIHYHRHDLGGLRDYRADAAHAFSPAAQLLLPNRQPAQAGSKLH